jgi:hypothetical protein
MMPNMTTGSQVMILVHVSLYAQQSLRARRARARSLSLPPSLEDHVKVVRRDLHVVLLVFHSKLLFQCESATLCVCVCLCDTVCWCVCVRGCTCVCVRAWAHRVLVTA